MTSKNDKTQYNSHLSQRVCVGNVSRVREKNLRVWHVFIAHGDVFSPHTHSVACTTFENVCNRTKTTNVQESCKMTGDSERERLYVTRATLHTIAVLAIIYFFCFV